jgi:anti-sigma-K factor RskA
MSAHERDLDELLGAYALDAVSPEERQAVEEYLAVNPKARAEVMEHREVATMLAWTGTSAPDGLWDRIAAQLDDAAPTPSGPLAAVLSLDESRDRPAMAQGPRVTKRRRVLRSVGTWAAMSAAAALIAVFVVDVVQSRPSTRPTLAAAADQARHAHNATITQLVGADGTVVGEAIIDAQGHGYLIADHLPALPKDRSYQLWGVIDGKAISLGVLGNHPEIEPFTAAGAITQVVVTNEAAGGVVSNGNADGAYVGRVG